MGYISAQVEAAQQTSAQLAGRGGEGEGEGGVKHGLPGRGGQAGAGSGRGAEMDDTKPSSLLKMLRPAAPQRPLFLAAPGVANAQVKG